MPLSLAEIFEAPKLLSDVPKWARNGRELVLLAPLEIAGVTQEGLYLRSSGRVLRPDAAIVMQLEVKRPGKRSGGQLERVCWATAPHQNPMKGPVELQGLEISHSHYHDFYLNVDESGNEMRKGNLRIARPIEPEPRSFSELLDFCAERFNIRNLSILPIPPWESDLFGETS